MLKVKKKKQMQHVSWESLRRHTSQSLRKRGKWAYQRRRQCHSAQQRWTQSCTWHQRIQVIRLCPEGADFAVTVTAVSWLQVGTGGDAGRVRVNTSWPWAKHQRTRLTNVTFVYESRQTSKAPAVITPLGKTSCSLLRVLGNTEGNPRNRKVSLKRKFSPSY